MKRLKFFSIFFLVAAISFYCRKNSSGPEDPGQLQIVKNSLLANSKNSLQAIYTSSDNSSKGYYYGSFNSSGNPDSITQLIINKTVGDTSINIFFDTQQRIKSLYLTYSGIKNNSLLTFDYTTPGKTLINAYYLNFNNDSSKLLYQYMVDNTTPNYALVSKTSYASFGSGLLQVLLQTNAGGVTLPDKFGSQLITMQGAIAGLNLIILTGTTAIGCLIGGFPGCVVGGIVGDYLIHKPASANASEITSPTNNPQSPYNQTQNTQLQKKSYYVATNASSGVVPFGGSPYCSYTAQYTNISLEIKFDKLTNAPTSAYVYGTMNEVTVGSCYLGPGTGIPSKHSYSFNNYQLSGNSITINFSQSAGFPNNITKFTGSISGSTIIGTLTLNRNNGDMPCIVSIPMTANLVN